MSSTTTSDAQTKVEVTRDADTATVWFRSERGVNVFSSRVLGQLGTHIEQLAGDAHLRHVVLRGEGKTFLAGADIAEMSHFDEAQGKALSTHGHHVLNAIEQLPQITFAAINGAALGGGCELALACDFRIMLGNAKIGQPECRLGLLPGWGGTQRLTRLIGPATARRLLFSGEALAADEALRMGLVDDVANHPDDLDDVLNRWFKKFAQASPKAITRIKRSVSMEEETNQFACCFSCSDAREGMQAFLEKRAADWAKPE